MHTRTLSSQNIFALSILFFFSIVLNAHAATLSVVFPNGVPSAGDTFTAQVRIQTEQDSLNAVEGAVRIPDGISISDVSTGNSAFSLWPTNPVFVVKDRVISFTGGTPSGIAPQKDALLFTFTAKAGAAGTYVFSGTSVTAYKNDGKGTRVAVVLPESSRTVVATGTTPPEAKISDTTAPVFLDVSIGKDAALFNGNYFVTFAATDSGTGVKMYEVKEGWFAPWVQADRYYVLKDQSLRTPVTVRATDAAGNQSKQTVNEGIFAYVPFMVALLGIVVVIGVWRLRRKQKVAHEHL